MAAHECTDHCHRHPAGSAGARPDRMATPHFEERSDSAEDDGQPTGEHHDGDQERLGDSCG